MKSKAKQTVKTFTDPTLVQLDYSPEDQKLVAEVLDLWDRFGDQEASVLPASKNVVEGSDVSVTYSRRSSRKLDDGGSKARQEWNQDNTQRTYDLPPIAERFYDDGESGTSLNRAGYSAFKSFGVMHKGCCAIIEDLDRASRDGIVGFDFGKWVIDNNIRLYDKNGLVTMERLLSDLSRASGAHQAIVERAQLGIIRAIHRGTYFPEPAYGLKKPKTGFVVPDPKTARWVVAIFEKAALERWSCGHIARWLDERGVVPARGGKHWNSSSVSNILHNFIYIGLTVNKLPNEDNHVRVPTPHTTIVDSALFATYHSRLRRRSAGTGKNTNGNRSLLAYKARCPCGATWTTHIKFGEDVVMKCMYRNRGCSRMPLVSKSVTERIVLQDLEGLICGSDTEKSFLERLVEREQAQEAINEDARHALDVRIAAEQAKIDRAEDVVYDNGSTPGLKRRIAQGYAAIESFREKRNKLLPRGSVAPVAEELRTLSGSLRFLMTQTPLKRVGSGSEAVIASIAAVIDTVTVEPLDNGMLRQTTTFDFNQEDYSDDLPELVRTVIRDYVPPVLSNAVRNMQNIEMAHASGAYDLSDAEFEALRQLPSVQRYFAVCEPSLRSGFNAIATVVCGKFSMKRTFRQYGFDPKTSFWKAFHLFRLKSDVDPFVDMFRTLRPGAPNIEAISRKTMGNQGHHRKTLETMVHPILKHPICCVGSGRTVLTEEEWKRLRQELRLHAPFRGLKTQDKTKQHLELYFSVVREGSEWSSSVPVEHDRAARYLINSMRKSGLLNEVCKVLLLVEGIRKPADRSRLPNLMGEPRRGRRTAPKEEAAA